MSLTTPSYFDYNTTPFQQGLTSNAYSFDNQNSSDGVYGLNKYKSGANNQIAPRSVNQYMPTQSPVMQQNFNITDAHDMIDQSSTALMPGDGGVGDATAQQTISQVKSDLSSIANSPNPDAMAQSIMSQPTYGSDSFGAGLMNIGLAVMQGASPMEVAKAGIDGSEYFEGRQRKTRMSEYLRDNVQGLLDQGYSPDSISAAISSGDNLLLKMQQMSAKDKRVQELQDETRTNAEWDRRTQVSQDNAIQLRQTESADAQARQAQADKAAEARITAADKKAEESHRKNFLDLPSGSSIPQAEVKRLSGQFKDYKNAGQAYSQYNQAYSLVNQLKDAKANGEDAAARSAYQQALEKVTKAMMGGNRSLSHDDMMQLGVDPSWIDAKTGNVALVAGFAPTDKQIAYLDNMVRQDHKSAEDDIKRVGSQAVKRYINNGYGVQDALSIVNNAGQEHLGGIGLEADQNGNITISTGLDNHETNQPKISASNGAVSSVNTTIPGSADEYASQMLANRKKK